ncbi:MAG TPA: hypothetical protein VOB72_02425 [Candidatus Dormibacteraeota bacterium]|nr:hypothetical protein [Candidatus Dormibacteraeota bacterium]
MYLRTYVDLALDFEEVRAALLRGRPPACLEEAALDAERECDALLAAAGLTSAGQFASWPTAVEADAPITTDRLASVPLCLYSGRTLLTRLATLDAGWLGAGRTHLSLSMSYDAHLDEPNGIRDRALLHRVHEAVALRFLDAIANRLLAATPV